VTLIKDLTKVGRSLERTIIVDNLRENFCWQKQNGVHVQSWTSKEAQDDTELLSLMKYLKQIALSETNDVRMAI
jgi:TFIIF-interacting CTD phosphatase-like protein